MENTKYDSEAMRIYDARREGKNWEHFQRITRRERDYWRALAQVMVEENLWEVSNAGSH